MLRYYIIVVFSCFLCLHQHAQPVAFPGAEGFGRFSAGGRGGKVYIVDNLTDHKKDPVKGSLRWAINKKGPRTIVFAVSGTISLEDQLDITKGDLTIAGQTAPGDGICIKNYKVYIKTDNVIIRFIRFRCGNEAMMSSAQDALGAKNCKNVIIDHCSMSWSIDETASFYDNKNFTLQWCIISESLNNSGHPKGGHGYGGIWGGEGATFHHNLLSCHTSRNPRFNGARYSTDSTTEQVDFRNNVIFNWGFESIYGGEEGSHNIVNNYFKPGPATKNSEVRYRILDLTEYYYDKRLKDTIYAGKFYIDGNYMEGNKEVTTDNWNKGVQGADEKEKRRSKTDKPFPYDPVETEPASAAYFSVLEKAGAILPKRDPVDLRIIEEVKTGFCKYGDTWGENSGIIDSQQSVGGWPELKTLPVQTDSDQDGMPDIWETYKGLNPNNAKDRNHYTLDKDYTNLEVYLNNL